MVKCSWPWIAATCTTYSFNESISFVIHCQGQAEVDYFWEKLTANGGQEMMCAWLKDRYGVAWQVVPAELTQLIFDPDPDRAQAATGAMMKMKKIEFDQLRAAAAGESRLVISINTTIAAPKEKVWQFYTSPEHVTQWNFASEDWHCPSATNSLEVGGAFTYRMEAKDGSMGFDFSATYTAVKDQQYLAYTLDDDRKVEVHFSVIEGTTFVLLNFEAEDMNAADLQRQGWQAILENFRQYVESN